MNINNNILFIILKDNNIYNKYINILDKIFYDNKELNKIYLCIKDFYKKHKEPVGSVDTLEVLYSAAYPADRPVDKQSASLVFDRLRSCNATPDSIAEYLTVAKKQALANEIALQAIGMTEGRSTTRSLVELATELENVSDDHVEKTAIVKESLKDLFETEVTSGGLEWRLTSLNRSIGPIRKGDFGFIFKRPETGGTTFLASEGSHMIRNMDGPLVWVNNEERSRKVKLRFIQSYFGVSVMELQKNLGDYSDIFDREVGEKFLILDDDVDFSYKALTEFFRHEEPQLIFIDQLDKVKGFTADRKDLEHGARYIWARDIAKIHCPVIGVSQAAESAENKMWLYQTDVADAKTSKQAEADWMIGIGAVDKVGSEDLRYFHICKNKNIGVAGTMQELRHGKMTLVIKPHLARYEDLPGRWE